MRRIRQTENMEILSVRFVLLLCVRVEYTIYYTCHEYKVCGRQWNHGRYHLNGYCCAFIELQTIGKQNKLKSNEEAKTFEFRNS